MASNFKISIPARNAAINAVVNLLDDDVTPGTVRIFDGTIPASPADADAGTLLSSNTFSLPAFAAAAAGAASSGVLECDTSTVAGTAQYFRARRETDSTTIFQGTVGLSAADLVLNDVTLDNGGELVIDNMVLSL